MIFILDFQHNMDVTDCVSSSGWPAAPEGRGGECWVVAEGGIGGRWWRAAVDASEGLLLFLLRHLSLEGYSGETVRIQ